MAKKSNKMSKTDQNSKKASSKKTKQSFSKKSEEKLKNKAAPMQPQNQVQLKLHKIYVRDASIKSSNVPEIFKARAKTNSFVALKLTKRKLPEPGVYEVIIGATASIQIGSKIIAVIHVAQAGIFSVLNATQEQIQGILTKICPEVLMPHLRKQVANMSVIAGFPVVQIKPVKFGIIPRRFIFKGKKKTTSKIVNTKSTGSSKNPAKK